MEAFGMETNIEKFYKDKTIFLTGGSGFVGKAFIEKTLRSTSAKKIYILLRPKRGKDIQKRIEDIFNDPLFDKLHATKENPWKQIQIVSGDCCLPGLGLSESDREELIANVEVVVNGAATVRFNEPLSDALAVNVQATLDLIGLAKKMPNLQAFVHVSSAFANCLEFNLKERFYANKIGIGSEKACLIANLLGAEKTNKLTMDFCKRFPNTYCFTKALAEEAILSNGAGLPICIIRPGMVISTCNEPVIGWIDNLYGPTSILYGVAYGVLRVMFVQKHSNANVVPVDFCVNLMLTSGWKTAQNSEKGVLASPTIYNLVPDKSNTLKWYEYKTCLEKYGSEMPVSNMIWYPLLICTDSKLFYKFLCFFCHTIPGYIFDMLLLTMGRKPRLVKAYQKIHSTISLLEYFTKNNFAFETPNTQQLWKSLTIQEQELFNFDMKSLDWKTYLYKSLQGMRIFLAKETPSTIPKAKKLYKRLEILHNVFRLIVYCSIITAVILIVIRIFF